MGLEQGLKGAGGGALAGSAFGFPGALVGGALGFASGMWGGGENEQDEIQRQRLMEYYGQIGNRQAPQMGGAAQSGYSDFRTNQSNLITRLEALASGKGPSLATQQFKEATDRNQAAQASMANSGRGGPMAALAAMNNSGLLGAQAAQGAAAGRIAEQNMALGHLGNNIQAGRGADEQTNMFNTGARNQVGLANLNARLQTMGMNDQARLQILSQLGGQNARQAQTPGLGDQILAGGAGLYGMYAGQQAGRMGSQAPSGLPSDSQIRNSMGYGTQGSNGLITPQGW